MDLIFIYLVILFISIFLAWRITKVKKRIFPTVTVVLCGFLTLCLLLQFTYPHLLPLFERNALDIERGQYWRIITALFFQDGGLIGGISNIFLLFVIGSLTEQLWNKKSWLILYFGTGIITELIAIFLQPIGAGNSIATFGLVASIFLFYIFQKNTLFIQILWILGSIGALILLYYKDIHGVAFLIGILISLYFKKAMLNLAYKI